MSPSHKKSGRSADRSAPQSSDLSRQAAQVVAHVRSLYRELFRNPYAEAEEAGLTGPQVTLVSHLVENGPVTLTALSTALGMSHSTASGIVDRLEARGLLARSEDASDRRRTVIQVTGVVSDYVRKLESGPAGRLASALARASATERRAIENALATLRQLLADDRDRVSRA